MNEHTAYALIALLFVAAVVLVPLAVIWSLNVLFALAIPFTLRTWAAALLLTGVLSASAKRP